MGTVGDSMQHFIEESLQIDWAAADNHFCLFKYALSALETVIILLVVSELIKHYSHSLCISAGERLLAVPGSSACSGRLSLL